MILKPYILSVAKIYGLGNCWIVESKIMLRENLSIIEFSLVEISLSKLVDLRNLKIYPKD